MSKNRIVRCIGLPIGLDRALNVLTKRRGLSRSDLLSRLVLREIRSAVDNGEISEEDVL